MKEFWKNLKGWQKGGIIFGFLAVILIIVVSVMTIINGEPKVEISFTENTNIPGDELRKVRSYLEGVIRNNTENFNSNTVYRGVARDYKETSSDDSYTATFVVDFDEIKESYKVLVAWPDPDDGSPNINVSCPLLESKYPETPCVTESNSSSDIVGYLPYEGTLSSGKKYKILVKYSGGKMYLEVITDGDPEQAIVDARKWVESLYLNPNNYMFYVPAKQYIQANHSETKDANVNKNLPYFMPGAYKVYPITDEDGNVTSIEADVAGCTEYQTNMAEEAIRDYLSSKGIDYPLNFEECYNI